MPKPTLENRRHFKNYVRYYKNKFTSIIQDATIDDIDGILSQKTSGISTTTPIKFIIFDNYDTVDVTSLKDNGDYIYLPGLPYDGITLRVNNIDYDFSFPGTDDGGIIYNGTTYQLNDTLNLPGIGITVNGLGGALLSLSPGLPVPTYSVGVGTTTINEGETISFTIETVNVGSGTTLYYQVFPTSGIAGGIGPYYGSGISTSDFLDSSLNGSFNIVGTGATTGIATITKTLINDFNTIEENETFVLSILTGSASSLTGTIVSNSPTITVINQGLPSFNIGISTNEITEGESVVFTVNSNNTVGIGTLYFTTSGTVSAEDFTDNSLTGSFNIVSTGATTGIATITRTISNDLDSEGSETFNIEIRTDSASTTGTLVATSSTITVNNLAPTFSISPSSININEGDFVDFTVTTTNVGAGTTLYYSTSGDVANVDFIDSSLTGSFNIVSTGATTGIATIRRTIANDTAIEGSESFALEIRLGSDSGTLVTTSSTVTVNNVDPPSYNVGVTTTIIGEGDSINFTINTTNASLNIPLYYSTSGTVSAEDFSDNSLTGSFNIVSTGATTGIATITRTLAYDLEYGSDETFNISIRSGSPSNPVVATSSTITVKASEAFYLITPSSSIITEGSSVNFVVTTTNVAAGTTLYYTTSGTVSAGDFSDNSLTGSFNIVSTGATTGIATITRSTKYDILDEESETFNLIIRSGSISGTIVGTSSTVTVQNFPPVYQISVSESTIDEIHSTNNVTFTVNTTGVPNGTVLYWTTTGSVTSSDFDDSSLTGSETVSNNRITFVRTIIADRTTEGKESFAIQIRTNSPSGPIVATSEFVTINDISQNVGQNANGLTFGPVQVNRDNGNPALASDWYTICGIDKLPEGSKIALFIDTSGSMNQSTIQASYNLLVSKLSEKNISIITVTNPNEDWITPFLTVLS